MSLARWLVQKVEDGLVHVMPLDDLIAHEEDEDCACGPSPEVVASLDGDGWVFTHHSLDGRELNEPDH